MEIEGARGDRLTAAQVYAIWVIRDAVFALEQRVDDADPDGLDLLAGTDHLWIADTDGIASYLRVLNRDGHHRVGRVCTRRDRRGEGLAALLMDEAARRFGHDEIRLGAQAHLERWYEGLGYRRSGEDFVEAGIEHVPMRRPPAPV